MKKPRIKDYSDEEEYLLACAQFKEALRMGDKQAIMSEWNSKYYLKKRQEKYERWKQMSENKIFVNGLRVEEKEITDGYTYALRRVKHN